VGVDTGDVIDGKGKGVTVLVCGGNRECG